MIKGALYIKPHEDFEGDNFVLMGNSYDYDYSITCILHDGDTFEELMNDEHKKEFLEAIRGTLDFLDDKEDSSLLWALHEYKGRETELLRSCKDIYFDEEFSLEEVATILKRDPFFKEKRTIIKCDGIFEGEYVSKLESLFSEFGERVVFKIPLNEHCISLSDFRKTTDKIKSITERVKSLKLSPLEQIMYVYDKVRDREFNRDSASEDDRVSRDLTSVLFGDKIVCEGFSNVFKTVLDNLNFKTIAHDFICRTDSARGHRRVSIYVKDEKYEVEGVYSFDVTWDSKNKTDDYLNSYRFFALTKEQFEVFQKDKLRDLTFGDFGYDLAESFIKYCREGKITSCPSSIIKSINKAYSFVNGCHLLPIPSIIKNECSLKSLKESVDLDAVIEAIEQLVDIFDRPLSADILLKVLFNVRKVEYYENPQKYHFDENTICSIVKNSKWVYDEMFDDLILAVLGAKESAIGDLTHERITQEGLDKTIALVKLTKTLSEIHHKKV